MGAVRHYTLILDATDDDLACLKAKMRIRTPVYNALAHTICAWHIDVLQLIPGLSPFGFA